MLMTDCCWETSIEDWLSFEATIFSMEIVEYSCSFFRVGYMILVASVERMRIMRVTSIVLHVAIR